MKTIASFMRGVRAFEEGGSATSGFAAMGHQVQHTLQHIAVALELEAMSGRTTIGQVLVEAAERWPDRIAVSFPDGARTYAELADAARRTARGLRALGVRPGSTSAC